MSEALRSFFKSIQQLSVKKNRDVYKKKTTLYYFGRFKRRTRFFSRCSRRNEVLFCFAICMTAAFNSCSKCSTRSCYQPTGASTLELLNLLKKKKKIYNIWYFDCFNAPGWYCAAVYHFFRISTTNWIILESSLVFAIALINFFPNSLSSYFVFKTRFTHSTIFSSERNHRDDCVEDAWNS